MKIGSILNYEKIGKPLGKGAQGEVWKVISNKPIALKTIRARENTPKFNNAKSEIHKLEKLSKYPNCHPNIICYYDHYYDPKNNYILIEMELIEGVTLERFSRNLRKSTPDKLYRQLLLILKDIIKAIKYIHDKGIIHNDIKTDNIMIDKTMTPKLIDFGLACVAERRCKLGNHKKMLCCDGFDGTFEFAAPEMFKTPYNRYPRSDVWSLGVSLYRAATGKYPFDFNLNTPNLRDVTQKINETEPLKLKTSNKLLNSLVNRMLIKDPTKRITVDDIANFTTMYK